MSFWNNVKEKISDANDSLQKNIGQFKNKNLQMLQWLYVL